MDVSHYHMRAWEFADETW